MQEPRLKLAARRFPPAVRTPHLPPTTIHHLQGTNGEPRAKSQGQGDHDRKCQAAAT